VSYLGEHKRIARHLGHDDLVDQAMKRWVLKVARGGAIALIALEFLYLLAGNLALSTGLVRRAVSGNPDAMLVTHGRAYTIFPGRVHVSDFAMRMQDRNIQFHLTIGHVRVDIHLLALLRKTFHGDHVRCEGVSFRFVHRVRDAVGMEARLAAYPPIPGLARPALLLVPPPPAARQEEIDSLWTVRLDDVDGRLRELWFLEHRWEGNGRVTGRFELSPMRRLRVGPAELILDGGGLRAGPHVVSNDLRLRMGASVESFDVQALDGMQVFRPISATVHLEAKDFSPALLALYVEGLTAEGAGRLVVDARVESGRLGRDTRMDLHMERARAVVDGFVYDGAPQLAASFDQAGVDDRGIPGVHATVPGSIVVRLPPSGHARVDLTGLVVDARLSGRDIAEGITLDEIDGRLGGARVVDARAVRAAILGGTPLGFISPILLGDGPLVASAAVDRRSTVTIALLRHARLGLAELRGAVRTSEGGWDGAVAGHIGFLPIGVRLRNGKTGLELFVSDAWLDTELAAAGIRFEGAPLAR
jgi:hypothetical protein